MAQPDYIYAVARIRYKELQCLNAAALEQLMSLKSEEECLRFLSEKGWGSGSGLSAEALLKLEREKVWNEIKELTDDLEIFNVFLVANDYHNLKAAIKDNYAPGPGEIYSENATIDPAVFTEAVKEHDFSVLPAAMQPVAEEALTALRETGDGQLCDILIDRAALEAILAAGKKSGSELLAFYAEHVVATANIKTALRCQKTGKTLDFIKKALAPCDSLDTDALAKAALEGSEAILDYLKSTPYDDATDAIRQSASSFERWCDNRLIEKIRSQKHVIEGAEPLAAWYLAKENEIKTVRYILSGKRNGLSDDFIRERLREMYV